MDSACHGIGCHPTREAWDPNALDDVASTIHQSVAPGTFDQRNFSMTLLPGPPFDEVDFAVIDQQRRLKAMQAG
jgi:hypothetical protein